MNVQYGAVYRADEASRSPDIKYKISTVVYTTASMSHESMQPRTLQVIHGWTATKYKGEKSKKGHENGNC